MVARAAAKTAAAKPTAAKGRTSKVVEEEPDLLAQIEEKNPVVDDDDDEDFDLLSDMSESDATAWMPWDEEDQPTGIQGKVTHIGTVQQDAKYGGDDVPYWEIQDRSDPDITWGVRGYATVLSNQMTREQDKGLRTGDIAAIAYLGVKSNRKGDNEYKNFGTKTKFVGHS